MLAFRIGQCSGNRSDSAVKTRRSRREHDNMFGVVNSTLTRDFISQSITAASDEEDLAIQVGDGFGIEVARVEIIDNPLHRW